MERAGARVFPTEGTARAKVLRQVREQSQLESWWGWGRLSEVRWRNVRGSSGVGRDRVRGVNFVLGVLGATGAGKGQI